MITKGRLHLTVLPQNWHRPKTREDCEFDLDACPWVGCRHHLFLEVMPNGKLKFARLIDEDDADSIARAIEHMPETCSLRFNRDPQTPEEIATLLNRSRQRIENTAVIAIAKLQRMHGARLSKADGR